MKTRTGIQAGGSNADDHGFGPDALVGGGLSWRFTVGQTNSGKHIFSPAMTRSAAKGGAALLLQGDESGARSAWGGSVCDWLDAQGSSAKEALYEAARELMRA